MRIVAIINRDFRTGVGFATACVLAGILAGVVAFAGFFTIAGTALAIVAAFAGLFAFARIALALVAALAGLFAFARIALAGLFTFAIGVFRFAGGFAFRGAGGFAGGFALSGARGVAGGFALSGAGGVAGIVALILGIKAGEGGDDGRAEGDGSENQNRFFQHDHYP